MSASRKLQVLFVDDEAMVLSGLRRQLRPRSSVWDIRFATSGADALLQMESRAADVVVSDMRMPGMTGGQLLSEVQRRWPNTSRLILSGEADQSVFNEHLGAIHQVLQKPCSPETLFSAIESVHMVVCNCELARIHDLVTGLRSLPVISKTLSELIQRFNDSQPEMDDVIAIVEQDMGIGIKLLQLVNSAFFGMPKHVSCIRQAATLLGLNLIRTLVMSAHVFDKLADNNPAARSIRALWQACGHVAKTAERAAQAAGQVPKIVECSALSGALSLVGRSILLRYFPSEFQAAQHRAITDNIPLFAAEQAEIGVSQQAVGGFALGLWGFPSMIVESVLHQAAPEWSIAVGRDHPLPYIHIARCIGEPSHLVETLTPSSGFIESVGLGELLATSLGAKA